MLIKTKNRRLRDIRGIIRGKDGISAVEFALIAPLMMLMYFACIELSFMMMLDRKVTSSAAALGDLTARASVVSNDDLDDIFQATRMIMQPHDISTARMRISSLYDDDGTVRIGWSQSCKLTAYTEDEPITVPANLVPSGGTVIFAEIEYDYNSSLGYMFTTAKTLKEEFYLRPRSVDEVTRPDDESDYNCSQFDP